jgi:hypothetical protein
MKRQKATSREYKVTLRPGRFKGDEKKLLNAASLVWRDFSTSVAEVVVDTHGGFEHIKVRRLITFFDTSKQGIQKAGYILRERRDFKRSEREVTLKFRHPDRYIAQDRDMNVMDSWDAGTKFEEDIKVPFVSLYSFSTTFTTGDGALLGELGDLLQLFPDLRRRMTDFREDDELTAVRNFTAHERVLCGGNLQIGKTPKVEAECALIVWHDHHHRPDTPVAVELSYRYGDKNESYGGATTQRAFNVFYMLQTELRRWVDPRPRTKTAFVYG